MYFPTSTARLLSSVPGLPNLPPEPILHLVPSPRKSLFCTVTRNGIAVWRVRVSCLPFSFCSSSWTNLPSRQPCLHTSREHLHPSLTMARTRERSGLQMVPESSFRPVTCMTMSCLLNAPVDDRVSPRPRHPRIQGIGTSIPAPRSPVNLSSRSRRKCSAHLCRITIGRSCQNRRNTD
jgi:hypothetical protein